MVDLTLASILTKLLISATKLGIRFLFKRTLVRIRGTNVVMDFTLVSSFIERSKSRSIV
jgi:hypothetical protein